MCLIFLAVNHHPDFKLIVAANRDEFYNRKTAPAEFWKDNPDVLAGRDLEAGGTWLGITKQGRISMITNYRDPKNINPNAPSRGQLVLDYLTSRVSPEAFLQSLEPTAKSYNGFNLLTGTPDEMWYFSNYRDGAQELRPGLYGLSNHFLETPWPKVEAGKKKMKELLSKAFKPEDFFSLLYDDKVAADDLLPDTGVGLERERVLSSMFIKSPGYGTRCSTVVMIDNAHQVFFTERVYDLETFSFTENSYTFKI
jgi:uncharacterized protein with NRDE domain